MKEPRVAVAGYWFSKQTVFEPPELTVLGALLRRLGCEVYLADPSVQGLDPGALGARVGAFDPDMVLLACANDTPHREEQWAAFVRRCYEASPRSSMLVIMYADVDELDAPEYFGRIPDLNAIVVGEPEPTIVEIVEVLKRSDGARPVLAGLDEATVRESAGFRYILSSPSRIESLDDLPFADRSVLRAKIERFGRNAVYASVLAGRGCRRPECTFCGRVAALKYQSGPAWRTRSPAKIAAEVEQVIDRYGVRRIVFTSPDFVPPGPIGHSFLRHFQAEIEARQLKFEYYVQTRSDALDERMIRILRETGCTTINIGYESDYPRDDALFNKGITSDTRARCLALLLQHGYTFDLDAKRRVRIGYIAFHPFTTLEGLKNGIDVHRTYGITPKKLLFGRLYLIPGTKMYDLVRHAGLLVGRYGYRFASEKVGYIAERMDEFSEEIWPYRERLRTIRKVCQREGESSILADMPDLRRHIDEAALNMFDDVVRSGMGEGASMTPIRRCYETWRERLLRWIDVNEVKQRVESAEERLEKRGLQLVVGF